MLTDERRALIVERLRSEGRVLAADLTAELDVSSDTIRRDLRELDRAGLLRRVHGGALPPVAPIASFADRVRDEPAAKATIARRASALVPDGAVVVIDAGTTTLEAARALPPELRATVVTTSPPVAVALADHPGVEVTVVGGRLSRRSQTVVGAEAVAQLSAIRADLVFLGVCGLHPRIGVTADDAEERLVKQAMLDGAAEVVALAAPDKLGTALPWVVAPIGALGRLVTSADADEAAVAPFAEAGVEVVRA